MPARVPLGEVTRRTGELYPEVNIRAWDDLGVLESTEDFEISDIVMSDSPRDHGLTRNSLGAFASIRERGMP